LFPFSIYFIPISASGIDDFHKNLNRSLSQWVDLALLKYQVEDMGSEQGLLLKRIASRVQDGESRGG